MELVTCFDPSLVEEAVALAVRRRGSSTDTALRRERDPIYDVQDREEREQRFRQLHAHWFRRLALDRPFADTIAEYPILRGRVSRCLMARAMAQRDETIDLADAAGNGDPPALIVRIRAERLADADALVPFLRHELMHVSDMLDPAFGYSRELRLDSVDASLQNLVRDRYRTIWDATIDGRLIRAGRLAEAITPARFAEFAAAFPRLGLPAGAAQAGDRLLQAFERWLDEEHPTHEAILAFAMSGLGERVCPICRCPTSQLDRPASRLSRAARGLLARDHPDWQAANGLCLQCADLYEARSRALA